MKHSLIIITIVALIISNTYATQDEQEKRVLSIKREIASLNLINGLNLSKKQITDLIQLGEQIEDVKTEVSQEKRQALNDAEKSFQSLKTELLKGAPAKGEIPRTAHRNEGKLKDFHQDSQKNLKTKFEEYQTQLRTVLSAEQVMVVESFKPCLIPSQDLNNPVRAGQADSSERSINWLKRARSAPEHIWKTRGIDRIYHLVQMISKRKYRMSEEEIEAEVARIQAVIEKVRVMSDVDFELEKESLAKSIRPDMSKENDLKNEAKKRLPMMKARSPKLLEMMLNKHMVKMLKEKLKKF